MKRPNNTGRWPSEPKEYAIELIGLGHSGRQIAAMVNQQFPGMSKSRNAIIGLAYRSGLHIGGGDAASRRINRVKTTKLKKPRKKPFTFSKSASACDALAAIRMKGAPLPPPQETDIPRVSFDDLEHHHCRWPCSETRDILPATPIFCGMPKIQGLSYCEVHAVRAYQPPQPRRPAPAAPVPQPIGKTCELLEAA